MKDAPIPSHSLDASVAIFLAEARPAVWTLHGSDGLGPACVVSEIVVSDDLKIEGSIWCACQLSRHRVDCLTAINGTWARADTVRCAVRVQFAGERDTVLLYLVIGMSLEHALRRLNTTVL
jgi:hypothetical protein